MLRRLRPMLPLLGLCVFALLGPLCGGAGAQDYTPPAGEGVGVSQTPLVVEDGVLGGLPFQLDGLSYASGNDYRVIPNTNYVVQFGSSAVVGTFPGATVLGRTPAPAQILFHVGTAVPDLSGLSLDIPSSGETAQAGSDRVVDPLANEYSFIAPINEPTTDPSKFSVFSEYFGPTKIAPSSWVLAESQTDTRVFEIDAASQPNQTPIFQLSQPRLPSNQTVTLFIRANETLRDLVRHSYHRYGDLVNRERNLQANLEKSLAYYDYKIMAHSAGIVFSDGKKLSRVKGPSALIHIAKELKAEANTLKLLWPNH